MKQSLRAKRMAKHHRRMGSASKLNLVSLMDIFTILVFFLLLNSSDVEVLQNNEAIKLPESFSEQRPDTTLVMMVNNNDLILAGRSLAKVQDLLARDEDEISELAEELKYQAGKSGPLSETEQEKGRAITIMGDANIPWALLEKIMQTCAANEYRDMSFAVSKVSAPDALSAEPSDIDLTMPAGGEASDG
jgi:biopolymer transport protein ExbD